MKKTSFWKKFRTIFLALLMAGLLSFVGFFTYASIAWGNYDVTLLEDYSVTSFVYDHEETLVHSLFNTENRVLIKINDLPIHVVKAFIAAEDLRFYKHSGVDVVRIVGALWYDIKTWSLSQGASTITQQLVKLTHLTADKTVVRKLKEAYYALMIERHYEKDDILEMYLNYVFFGANAYGIETAAQTYFDRSASELSVAQAASLAAILKATATYSPVLKPENNVERRNMIIDIMLENGFISQEQADEAKNTPLEVVSQSKTVQYGWFLDQALDYACAILSLTRSELATGGYHIYTTLDVNAQTACDLAAADASLLAQNAAGQSSQCASVVLQKDGAVAALCGGTKFESWRSFSRAADAQRQPGSVLKPLSVYCAAIEQMHTRTVTYMQDQPMEFDGYAPSNYGEYYYGYVSLRTAFEKSLNIPAVSLLYAMGPESARSYLEKFQIPLAESDRYLSLALGSMTYGVSPLSLSQAYLAFLNGGVVYDAYMVKRIEDNAGNVIYQHSPRSTKATSSSAAYLVCDMMQSTARIGTAKKLAQLGYAVGAKTGTVDFEGVGNRDAWCVAITPEHVVTVWMGFDNTDAVNCMTSAATGGNYPTAMARTILAQYLPQGDGEFLPPATVIKLDVDKKTLEESGQCFLATDITPDDYRLHEVFEASNRPYESSAYWKKPMAPALIVQAVTGIYPAVSFASQGEQYRYRVYKKSAFGYELIYQTQNVPAGGAIQYTDMNVSRISGYTYYVLAEHALAADSGMTNASVRSRQVTYRVSFFSLPFWD